MTAKTMNDLWAVYEVRQVRPLKTAPELTRLWTAYLSPVFGARSIDKINYAMIDFFHQEMKATPFQANRCLVQLRSMFKYAQAIEWLPYGHNPARFVKMHREKKRKRHMTVAEAPRIANEIVLREKGQPDFAAFIWLSIFTGARAGELHSAEWSDLKDNVLTLHRHKTDRSGEDRIIVLPPFAIEKLNTLLPVAERKKRMFSITRPNLTRHWNNSRRDAGCPDLRMNDLRHTFATYALEQGFTLDQIGQVLGHADAQTTKIYAEMTNRSRHKVAAHSSLAILHDMKIIEVGHNQYKDML